MPEKWVVLNKDQEELVRQHVAAERERCAKIAEEFETHAPGTGWITDAIAAAIRNEE